MTAVRGRPPKYNLLRHGYDVVAEYAHNALCRKAGRHALLVADDGTVRVIACSVMGAGEYDAHTASSSMLGTYTRQVPIEVLEDNLLARLRELHEKRAAGHGLPGALVNAPSASRTVG